MTDRGGRHTPFLVERTAEKTGHERFAEASLGSRPVERFGTVKTRHAFRGMKGMDARSPRTGRTPNDPIVSPNRRAGTYDNIALSDDAIARKQYKAFLGGGEKHWARRGLFQLDFLRARGLTPDGRLLDVGCGPIRAGVHFIRYLEVGNYSGIDYNRSFIDAAEAVLIEEDLAKKRPSLATVQNFDFGGIGGPYDYVVAFSVLNHCVDRLKRRFFENVVRCTTDASKIYISHARWLQPENLNRWGLSVAARFLVSDLDLGAYGWSEAEQHKVCPIYELRKSSA
jgi:SAM-dependent methyltransferase